MDNYTAVGLIEGFVEAESEEQVIQAWQYLVDTGIVWSLQGRVGRQAHDMLNEGILEFPDKQTFDYYGNPIPTKAMSKDKHNTR